MPAAAEATTCPVSVAALPAAHTPGTEVAPMASVSSWVPKTTPALHLDLLQGQFLQPVQPGLHPRAHRQRPDRHLRAVGQPHPAEPAVGLLQPLDLPAHHGDAARGELRALLLVRLRAAVREEGDV